MDDKQVIAYWRETLPGNQAIGLDEIVVEQRGIRDFVLERFRDPSVMRVGVDIKGTPTDTYASLFDACNQWLKQAGEKDFLAVAAEADKAKKSAKNSEHAKLVEDLFFLSWANGVSTRHGYLSPEAMAATFLCKSDYLHRRLSKNDELRDAVYAFADAWHWMHFEAHGEHELAARGVRLMQDRAAGPETKKLNKRKKDRVTEIYFSKFAKDPANSLHLRSAKGAAGAFAPIINPVLEELKLDPYSAVSLERKLRPLLNARSDQIAVR